MCSWITYNSAVTFSCNMVKNKEILEFFKRIKFSKNATKRNFTFFLHLHLQFGIMENKADSILRLSPT